MKRIKCFELKQLLRDPVTGAGPPSSPAFLESLMSEFEIADFNADEPQSGPSLHDALVRMHEALEILDGLAAPGDIGAHLDLAIHRLRQEIERNAPK
jgi:hypothetical protein